MDKFIERLKELRAEKKLTQSQLAKETGLSQSAIALWENGQRIPNASAIITLCKYFAVMSDFLLGISD